GFERQSAAIGNPQSAIRNPQSAIRNRMIDDTAIAALQRSLSENREAKRKIKIRLAELEAEAEMLHSQMATFDAIIEQTELALRRVLFPQENTSDRLNQRTESRLTPRLSRGYDHADLRASEVELEAEVENIERREQSGNVRFNDFRIPQAATIVLREANRPLHVSEIYRRMADGGYEFRGQHHLITLAVSLSRSKRFRKVAPGTFELNPNFLAGQVA
ncbi:MAG: hypothetical protein J2P41_08065, partial [Blastocatellia bacterium]|nr:hypothetical protein [Blastocatellia bacterium]